MKRISGSRIIVAIGLAVFAVATWFASRPPEVPQLPVATIETSSSPITPSTTPASVIQPLPVLAQIPAVVAVAKPPTIIKISVTSPTSDTQWVIGTVDTISWNKPAGVPGQMYLVDAASGKVAGWILQNIAPGQSYFPWNTRDLFVTDTSPAGKDVLPGKYIIKMSFASPQVAAVVSAPFSIVATATAQ